MTSTTGNEVTDLHIDIAGLRVEMARTQSAYEQASAERDRLASDLARLREAAIAYCVASARHGLHCSYAPSDPWHQEPEPCDCGLLALRAVLDEVKP